METLQTDPAPLFSHTSKSEKVCCGECNEKSANETGCHQLNVEIIKEALNNKATLNLNEWQPDALADYIYREHHQYYYTEEPLLTELLAYINHLKAKEYDLKRLEGLFVNLRNNLTAHFHIEETLLFPV